MAKRNYKYFTNSQKQEGKRKIANTYSSISVMCKKYLKKKYPEIYKEIVKIVKEKKK